MKAISIRKSQCISNIMSTADVVDCTELSTFGHSFGKTTNQRGFG